MRSAYAHDNFSARARATPMLPLCSTLTSARLVCCTGDLMLAQYEAVRAADDARDAEICARCIAGTHTVCAAPLARPPSALGGARVAPGALELTLLPVHCALGRSCAAGVVESALFASGAPPPAVTRSVTAGGGFRHGHLASGRGGASVGLGSVRRRGPRRAWACGLRCSGQAPGQDRGSGI